MARTSVRVRIDRRQVETLLADVTEASAGRAARRVQERVTRNIVASGRVRTGRMRDSVRSRRVSHTNAQTTYEVYSDVPYTIFQEDGIGPVYPVRAKVLRFRPKGSNVFIFRPRTKGFKGAHFFRQARASVTLDDFLK